MGKIKPGDVVQLKSGGPLMVVATKHDNGFEFFCTWFNTNLEIRHESFYPYMLKKA